eukprot:6202010-Pleurochrysis_carterae.AAC.4
MHMGSRLSDRGVSPTVLRSAAQGGREARIGAHLHGAAAAPGEAGIRLSASVERGGSAAPRNIRSIEAGDGWRVGSPGSIAALLSTAERRRERADPICAHRAGVASPDCAT